MKEHYAVLEREENTLDNHNGNYKKTILSIGRRLLIYTIVFFVISFIPSVILREMQKDGVFITNLLYYTTTGIFLIAGALIGLLIWRFKRKHSLQQLVSIEAPKKMTLESFFLIVSALFGARFLSNMVLYVIDYIFTELGIPATVLIKTSPDIAISLVFVGYLCIVAPIVEELIFRGFIAFPIARYGKIFSIIFSSIIFSLFHANISQSVFTIFVGILFCYVAIEYGIRWSIIAHVINNFLLAIVFDLYIANEVKIGNVSLTMIVEFVGFLIVLVAFLNNFQKVRQYIHENKIDPEIKRYVLTRWHFILYIVALLYFIFRR